MFSGTPTIINDVGFTAFWKDNSSAEDFCQRFLASEANVAQSWERVDFRMVIVRLLLGLATGPAQALLHPRIVRSS
jgi:hypothetical protein